MRMATNHLNRSPVLEEMIKDRGKTDCAAYAFYAQPPIFTLPLAVCRMGMSFKTNSPAGFLSSPPMSHHSRLSSAGDYIVVGMGSGRVWGLLSKRGTERVGAIVYGGEEEERKTRKNDMEREMPSRTDGESAEKSDLDSDYERSLGRERYLKSMHVAPLPESSLSTTPPFLSRPCDSIPSPLHTPTCPYPYFQNPLAMNASGLETSTPTRQQTSRARLSTSRSCHIWLTKCPSSERRVSTSIPMIVEKGSIPPTNIRMTGPRLFLQPEAEV
ncbi:hypothetical protein I350_04712 [Cryptococcus amylolentus CBS 6273]|uniref:Uncharacterized protein n=1 Tax=Cryptococcus amylolentus CBS 6273 TaxID=1296118 RepID=A0A1E3JXX4_9TREE|nr:hypothetical protein I350_04712 [Cryptococcus amylolentus CBS 6273]